MFYERLEGKIKCRLCNHFCTIEEGKRGICAVRENRAGSLYSLVYGKLVSAAVDPIEKKPFFHFYPGSEAYSIASIGCNFRCAWCQNWEISQYSKRCRDIIGMETAPEEVVEVAKHFGCRSIAYTYTEPTIFMEYALDIMKLARAAGIKNVFVTNGYMSEEALREAARYLDASNIDLKSFSDETYEKRCGARLEPVLDSIRLHKELGIWVEVTTLVIPDVNDKEEELRAIAKFLKSVGGEIPWHITGFRPEYEMLEGYPTPELTLFRAREIGKSEGLRYVYAPFEGGGNTFCYSCGSLLVLRDSFSICENRMEQQKCCNCGAEIDGRF